MNSLSHFISRPKRFRPFDYACLLVRLLQTPAVDCIVHYGRPYSPLQWTVQSAAGDCNNLPFKRPWLTARNGLLFPLWGIRYKEIKQWFKSPRKQCDPLQGRDSFHAESPWTGGFSTHYVWKKIISTFLTDGIPFTGIISSSHQKPLSVSKNFKVFFETSKPFLKTSVFFEKHILFSQF